MNPCPYCGVPMSNPRRVQCGAPECKRQHLNAKQRRFFADYKAKNGVRYEDRYSASRTCVDCGGEFRTKHESLRCWPCGSAYGRAAGNATQAASFAQLRDAKKAVVLAGPVRVTETLRFRMAQERIARAAAGTRAKNVVWVGGSCACCGARFVAMWTNMLPRFCSQFCLRKDSKRRDRARKYATIRVRYRPVDIYERDRWTCRLCGKRVKRHAKTPDPLAPTIDHIVPLAAGRDAGGVDAPWNVQCAHFICNSIKGDRLVAAALF